ncbi:5-methylcytosine restriction system specificity protein McrC [Rathayibacter sp. KR2-224]|uniref:5-methylcytosine restriction system specificity protein McrC n=1 Tax=Rathayibacter sp. KR2-224 TaxID=3400913 RepID=UPI003C00D7B8
MTRRPMANPTTSPERMWIRASPRGTRSGFAVLPDGGHGVVTVTVLPKPWAVRADVLREFDHRPGATTHIVLYEKETALVRSASAGSLALAVAAFSDEHADLVELGVEPKTPKQADVSSLDPFKELIDVMLLADRSRLTSGAASFEGAFAPSFLRLLEHERFLNEVEPLLFRARPRYEERTEALGMPRGRLKEKSLLHSIATGVPVVESVFDELTMDTPLLRVVASALRVVATDQLPPKIARLRPTTQSRATLLLRHLTAVRLIRPEDAMSNAERLWLGPLDRIWQPVVDAALPVLRSHGVAPEDGDEHGEGLTVHISMEKFWEQCLEVALQSAFPLTAVSRDSDPAEGVDVPRPWAGGNAESGDSFPDFMVKVSQKVILADAKYKMNTGTVPSSQDGYQMFAYSHLAMLNGQASDLALLLYPAKASSAPNQVELARLRDRAYPLWMVTLPFPAKGDVRSSSAWGAYVSNLAAALRDFSAEWQNVTNAA